MGKFFKTILYSLAVLSFAQAALANNYAVMGQLEQSFDAQGVRTVKVFCYCENGFVRKISESDEIGLMVVGTEDSVGYHGDQVEPKEVSKKRMSFTEMRDGPVLKLESREYTYIHHGYRIDYLQITAPNSVEVILSKLKWEDLQKKK